MANRANIAESRELNAMLGKLSHYKLKQITFLTSKNTHYNNII